MVGIICNYFFNNNKNRWGRRRGCFFWVVVVEQKKAKAVSGLVKELTVAFKFKIDLSCLIL